MELTQLHTEQRNAATSNLDTMSALELVTAMNKEDATVTRAVKKALPAIAKAVDLIAQQLIKGGRLIYVGTGTSGRIGTLDAAECPPTFGVAPEMVQCLMAGGEQAQSEALEASEDSAELGRTEMAAKKPGRRDVIIGLAASGRTPYTIGAMRYAASRGSVTIAVTCNRGSELGRAAAHCIEVDTGAEVLTGSTRLKAGTTQKLICNMLTTGAMAQLGYVYGNLMVNLQLTNEKLRERGIGILQSIAGVDRDVALQTLEDAGMSLSVAVVMLKSNVKRKEAMRRLRKAKQNVRKALEE